VRQSLLGPLRVRHRHYRDRFYCGRNL